MKSKKKYLKYEIKFLKLYLLFKLKFYNLNHKYYNYLVDYFYNEAQYKVRDSKGQICYTEYYHSKYMNMINKYHRYHK